MSKDIKKCTACGSSRLKLHDDKYNKNDQVIEVKICQECGFLKYITRRSLELYKEWLDEQSKKEVSNA